VGNTVVTDYRLTLNYTIYVDSNQIANLSQVVGEFILNNTIIGTNRTIPTVLTEVLIVSGFNFTPYVSGQYNQQANGTITGILHTLPLSDYWGNTMTYSFSYYAEASCLLKTGSGAQASQSANLPSQAFTVNWK
jgi:hypothetical protein